VIVAPPAPGCNRVELSRLVDQCIEETRRCVIQAHEDLGIALAECLGNPVCTAANVAKYLLALRRCKEALERCDVAAKRATNCQ
jgi:hypothetical protein